MQIHLSPRHLKLTAAIHQHAAGLIVQMEDLADIIAAHVVLVHDAVSKPADRFCVKVHLALSGADVFAEASAETIHVALDSVSGKLSRQLRKRKTATIDKTRSKAQRAVKRIRQG